MYTNSIAGLKDLRLSKKLSQEKMARLLDVSLSMYCKVETGRALPSRNFMSKIKNEFPNANIDEIFFSHSSTNCAI